MTKEELRNKIKQINFSSEYIKYSDEIIFNKVIKSEVFEKSKILFIYVSRKVEVDTLKIIQHALEFNKIVCVPKCFENSEMKVYQINSLNDLENGNFNILEPKNSCKEIEKNKIDLAIIPCITCDINNNRLGYGKGYYDRYLVDFNGIKLCLCRKQLLQEKIPTDEYDIKMDEVLVE